jgi:hypothetical protein
MLTTHSSPPEELPISRQETALELGPGTALSHMASAPFPDGRAPAVEEFRTLAGLRTWLQRAMG